MYVVRKKRRCRIRGRRRRYFAAIELQPEGGYTVTFRDVPEIVTQGRTYGEALRRAQDALDLALSFEDDVRRPAPASSGRKRGDRFRSFRPCRGRA
jgi:antitoxin HicB